MNHSENVAKRLLESVLVGTSMKYHNRQSQGGHDFDLCYPDGRVCPVEVTSAANKDVEDTIGAILDKRKGGPVIPTKHCKKAWDISPSSRANINKIRSKADEYLAAIEFDGREKFFGPYDSESFESVKSIYDGLGIIAGFAMPWEKREYIRISLPFGGSAVNAGTVIEAVKREAFKDDNRRKLRAVNVDERHLAVYIHPTNYSASCALVNFEPPPDLPQLPSEVTVIWVFSEGRSRHEYMVWRAGTSTPWRSLGPVVPNKTS